MYQQSGVRWLDHLRAPRVGIGAFGIGIVTAFLAGVMAISLLAGSLAAPSPQVGGAVAVPAVPAVLSGPLYDDQGTPSRIGR